MNLEFYKIKLNDIGIVKPLWEKLNLLHQSKSDKFAKWFSEHTFEERLEQLYEKEHRGQLRIEVVKDSALDVNVGFCISSIFDGNRGEIDSLFVESVYRGHRIGDRLITSALNWLESNNISDIEIMAYYGNEVVLPFYARYGFEPKKYILYRKTD
ncbi:GNAT family N-acetyltransferase [Ruminiclostridium josui]|uniref:GNAT family N-acetyltransferase n=1 Tax=Ruminiclostridium josui TaxID=1499 RepID=UPI0004670E9C|nr:GNAT family N-acetyltransferase [Ruminiclostridium josui]